MKKFDSINVIPFVDIMLVLLAIVLTTSTLVQKNLIPISLPKSSSKEKIVKKSLSITIKENGEIFFEKERVLKDEFVNKLKDLSKKSSILINCDKNAKFQNFVFVLDKLKERGFQNISIVTKNE